MKTLLVNPPYAFSEVPILPVGIAYVAAVLEESGHEVQVLDLLVSKCSRDNVVAKVREYGPDIVGVTSVTMNYPVASEILRHCKSVSEEILTVIGGPHVTFAAAETLNEAPWIDVVVRGEGELTMLDIVGGKKLEEIDGIAYRSEGVRFTGPRGLIQDLDGLPLPARHLFPLSRYHALDVHGSVITGRGCPFNCIFCVGSKMGGRRVRYRDPKLVVDDMEQALSQGFKKVNFEDDLLTVNHRRLHAICDEIIARGIKSDWSAFSRADTVNPEILRKMKEAGCTWLLYGVESGNQEILDTVKKKITLEKIKAGVLMAKEAGINILASFIIGLPGETRETLRQTVQFAEELDTFYGFNVLSPFPGTEVRERAEEYGIKILTNDWSKYDANKAVTRTDGAGEKEISEVLRRYFESLNLPIVESEKETDADLVGTVEPRLRSPLAWTLLQGDVIEGLGATDAVGDPVEGLVDRLAETVPYSRDQVSESIRRWVDEGLLKYELSDGRIAWNWN